MDPQPIHLKVLWKQIKCGVAMTNPWNQFSSGLADSGDAFEEAIAAADATAGAAGVVSSVDFFSSSFIFFV